MAKMEPFDIEAEMTSLLNDMTDEDLRSFAELQDDPASDGQVEVYIYACLLIFMRSGSAAHLEQAIRQTKDWVTVTPTNHSDRTRRVHILDIMSARVDRNRSTPESIVPGVE